MSVREDVLDAAKRAVSGERQVSYGGPENNFRRIANLWDAHLVNTNRDIELTEADVAVMLAMVKIARIENDPQHTDSWIDLAGYAACGAEVADAKVIF